MCGKRFRLKTVAFTVGFVGLLLTALWAAGSSRTQSQVLPDGAMVTVGEVTYGTSHRFTRGNRGKKLLARLLPLPVARAIGWEVQTSESEQPDARVWASFSRKPDHTTFERADVVDHRSSGDRERLRRDQPRGLSEA